MDANADSSLSNAEQLEFFTVLPDHAEFRPLGKVSLWQGVALVSASLKHACHAGQTRLLVDVSQLTGFESPTVSERYIMVRQWADIARGQLRLAMIAREEMIDPERFGIIVARNAGLNANIFANKPDALEWLRSVA